MLKCDSNIATRSILALFAFALACQGADVIAQRAFFAWGQQADQEGQANEALEKEFEQFKSVQEQRLATRIADMKRICELSDEQVTKLQVAAKGAIEKSMKVVRKQYTDMLTQWGMIADAVEIEAVADDNDEELVEETDENDEAHAEDEENAQAGVVVNVEMLGMVRQNIEAMGNRLATPENERVWKNAVSKTLTDEQSSAYAETVSARTARLRKAAVETFVAKVDSELLLLDSQRNELIKLIDDRYGLALQKDAVRSYRQEFFQFVDLPDPKINSDAKKVLSDSQYLVWKSEFATELERIATRNGRDDKKGGIWGQLFGN